MVNAVVTSWNGPGFLEWLPPNKSKDCGVFCVSRLCFVVLCHAQLWISNGHPASVVAKYQHLAIEKNQNFGRASSYEIGGRDLAAPLVDIVVLRAEVAGLRQVTSAGRDSDGSSYLPTSLYERFHIDAPAT